MASLADIAKILVPVLAGAAGAAQPKTADVLSDIVNMRQAFKDKERRTRREDESDARQVAQEERAKTTFAAGEKQYAREQDQLAQTDATVQGMMRNLPTRFREDPAVMQLANEGNVSGILDYINKEVQGLNMEGTLKSLAAQNAPNQYKQIEASLGSSPGMWGTAIQSLAPDLLKGVDPLVSLGDLSGIKPGKDTVISTKVDLGGGRQGSATVYPPGGRSSDTAPKDWENPTVIVRRTKDFIEKADEIVNRYRKISTEEYPGAPSKSRVDTRKMKWETERAKRLDDVRDEYIRYRDKYFSDTEKWPDEYRVPLLSWEDFIKQGGLRYELPTEGGGTEKKVSEPDKPTTGKTADEFDAEFVRIIEAKQERGEPISEEEFNRYWAIKEGGG